MRDRLCDIVIRPAVPGDEVAIVGLVRGLAAHVGDEGLARVTPEALRLAMHGEGRCIEGLIADVDGVVAGICLYSRIFSTWRGVPGFYVIDLFVEARRRSEGIGERLLQRLAAQGAAAGYGFLRLDVDHQNLGAQRFYRRLGFDHVERDRSYAIGGEAFRALAAAAGSP